MTKYLLFLIFSFGLLNLQAQGRIDTLDIENYQIKKLKIDPKLEEISSLVIYKEHYWGVNDSGGKAELYKIHPNTGKIVQTVQISNAKNVDWEEITFSDDYVFIGDFGNNLGNRKDLSIYYFPIQKLDNINREFSVEAEKIEFYFPEQTEFNPGNKKTNFDCEAFFFYNGLLHLFTKEWTNLATTRYTLEVKPGTQKAIKNEIFETNYLVSGATIDPHPISNTHGFYLIGYTLDGFALISGFSLSKNEKNHLFSDKINKFSLPLGFVAELGQTEGIAIKPDQPNIICYSAEKFKYKNFLAEQNIQCIHSLAQ